MLKQKYRVEAEPHSKVRGKEPPGSASGGKSRKELERRGHEQGFEEMCLVVQERKGEAVHAKKEQGQRG